MHIVDIEQGTDEWHAYRKRFFNASDAPAMMGVSKYKSRDELIKEFTHGKSKVSSWTQKIFDQGHLIEAVARPIGSIIIGSELSPIVANDGGCLSASLDGITKDHKIIWEHKMLNKAIRGYRSAEDIELHYLYQIEQELLVTGAEQCLFMATKWSGSELVEYVSYIVLPDMQLRANLIAGWDKLKGEIKWTNA